MWRLLPVSILADRFQQTQYWKCQNECSGVHFPGLPKNASLEELQNFLYGQGPAQNSTFQPVDGGFSRACRGTNLQDNRPSNYKAVSLQSVEACEQRCMESYGCVAIEYSNGRCELWLKKVEATKILSGFPQSQKVARFCVFLIIFMYFHSYTIIKGSLDEKLPSYEVLKMLRE